MINNNNYEHQIRKEKINFVTFFGSCIMRL